jgi:saccharopine dehydrogenase-like NADP-dependent oxidoreductase
MKVLALGGSGGMGRYAVQYLHNIKQIEKIYVADVNSLSAKKFASHFDNRVEGLKLDIRDFETLKSEMSKVDIVVNTTGPFFLFAEPILKAAIQTNTHYFDICDDWEPTEKMLQMNEDAKKANITAIIGLGASPGLTNILAHIAISELDEVRKVYTGWDMSAAKPESESSQSGVSAAMVHGIEQMIGEVKIFKNGNFEMVKPLEEIKVDYPDIGKRSTYIFGHPEAITFPNNYQDIKESYNLMHGIESSFIAILKTIRFLINMKIITKNFAARILTWLESLNGPDMVDYKKENLPSIYGYAEGLKGNKLTSIGVTIDGDINSFSMGEATSLPLTVGVQMFIEGKINKNGVHTPESPIIDPKIFFDYFKKGAGDNFMLNTIITKRT